MLPESTAGSVRTTVSLGAPVATPWHLSLVCKVSTVWKFHTAYFGTGFEWLLLNVRELHAFQGGKRSGAIPCRAYESTLNLYWGRNSPGHGIAPVCIHVVGARNSGGEI